VGNKKFECWNVQKLHSAKAAKNLVHWNFNAINRGVLCTKVVKEAAKNYLHLPGKIEGLTYFVTENDYIIIYVLFKEEKTVDTICSTDFKPLSVGFQDKSKRWKKMIKPEKTQPAQDWVSNIPSNPTSKYTKMGVALYAQYIYYDTFHSHIHPHSPLHNAYHHISFNQVTDINQPSNMYTTLISDLQNPRTKLLFITTNPNDYMRDLDSRARFHWLVILLSTLAFCLIVTFDRRKSIKMEKMGKRKRKTRIIRYRATPTSQEYLFFLMILFGAAVVSISVPYICFILVLACKRDPWTDSKRLALKKRKGRKGSPCNIIEIPISQVIPNFRHLYNMFLNADKESYKRRNLKTALVNIRGIKQAIFPSTDMENTLIKLAKLEELVKNEDPDIIVLTETNIPGTTTRNKIDNSDLQKALKGYRIINCGDETREEDLLNTEYHASRKGVAICIKLELTTFMTKPSKYAGRLLNVDFNLPGSNSSPKLLRYICIYAPATKDAQIDESIKQKITSLYQDAELANREAIILGDFNATMNPSIDRNNQSTSTTPESEILKTLASLPIADVYRSKYPDVTEFSFSGNTHAQSRIDLIFASKNINSTTLKIEYVELGSAFDHKALIWNREENIDANISTLTNISQIDTTKATEEEWVAFQSTIEEELEKLEEIDSCLNWCEDTTPQETLDRTISLLDNIIISSATINLPTRKRKNHRSNNENSSIFTDRSFALKQANSLLRDLNALRTRSAHATGLVNIRIGKINETEPFLSTPIPTIEPEDKFSKWKNIASTIARKGVYVLNKQSMKEQNERVEELTDKLNRDFEDTPGRALNTVLGKSREKVVINKFVEKNEQGGITNIYTDAATVLTKVRETYLDWFKKPETDIPGLLNDHRFARYYAEPSDAQKFIFKDVMKPVTLDETKAAINSQPNKAGGASKITAPLLQHLPPSAYILIQSIFNSCLRNSIIPKQWSLGLVYPTPKGEVTWDSDVTNTRPITLLEILEKSLLGITTDRASAVCAKHDVMKGNNPSVLPGTSTDDTLFPIMAQMEDARENDKELWLVFLDIKRAFDSVSYEMLSLSLRRVGLPESYILLHYNMNRKRRLQIITDLGLTDELSPGGGVPQGGKECPLHWRLFFDPLLVSLADQFHGYKTKTQTRHPIPSQVQKIETKMVSSSFVDDTTLAASSLAESQAIADHTVDYFNYVGIRVNASKTKLIIINESEETKLLNLKVDGKIITRSAPSKGERLLGIWLSADGLWKTQKEIIFQFLDQTVKNLQRRSVTDQILAYIINMVIIPNLLYKCKGLPLTNTEINDIDIKIRKLFKRKTGHALDLPSTYLYHEKFYNLTSFKDRLHQETVTLYKKRLSNHCPFTIGRELSLSNRMLSPEVVSSNPRITFIPSPIEKDYPILSRVKVYLATDDIILLPSHPLHKQAQTNIERQLYSIDQAIDDELILAKHRKVFAKHNLYFIDQLISNDGTKSRTWTEFRKLYINQAYIRHTSPRWFQALIQSIAKPDIDATATTYEQYEIDPELGLNNWNEMASNPCVNHQPGVSMIPRSSKRNIDEVYHPDEGAISNNESIADEFFIHPKLPRTMQYSEPMSMNETEFLRDTETSGKVLVAYPDGSAIRTDTQYARARSGIFMAREADIIAFENDTYHTMLEESISLIIKNSKEESKYRGKAAEKIVDEIIQSLDQQYPSIRFSGEIVDGPYQSWYGEYMAIYQALLNIEKFPNIKLKIYTDHQSLANLFSEITKCSDTHFNSIQNLTGLPILSAIRHLERQRRTPTKVSWVKAHSGIFGNVIADHLAGQYAADALAIPCSQKFKCPDDFSLHASSTVALSQGRIIQDPIRKQLKRTHKIREQITGEPHLSKHSLSSENDWEYTFSVINEGVKVSSHKTSKNQSNTRTYNMKNLAGLLFSQERADLIFSDLYPNADCRLCFQTTETNNHIWTCGSQYAIARRTEILTNTQKLIHDTLVGNACNHPRSMLIKEMINRIPCLNVSYTELKSIFQHIDTPVEITEDVEKRLQQVTFQDLAIGTLPKSLVESICIFNRWVNPQAYPDKWATISVKNKVYQIMSVLHKDAREYWNERCAITVAWEEANGITKKQKKKTVKVKKVDNDEPEKLKAKKQKKTFGPKKDNKRIIAHAVRITEAHNTLDCVNSAIIRRPDPTMQYSNPPKRLKLIDYDQVIRRLPQPDSKDERLENIYKATVEPIYIPMLQIPDNGEIIIHLDDDEDLINIEHDITPNVFFRKGGLKRPREEEELFKPRTRSRWN
jgi:exonuclease III/ribonuclease HI